MQLAHYSDGPVIQIFSVAQSGEPAPKQRGIWVSDDACDDNWRTWCIGERFRVERLAARQEFVIGSAASVLVLRGAGELDLFTREYGARLPFLSTIYINWQHVASRYQGIIITPYIWERRLADHAFWYYGWDCASGCIWDASAVEKIVPLPALPVECEAAA